MTDPTYRIKTDGGLSKQYTLQRLLEKHAAGVVEDSVECTPDDGQTWAQLGSLLMSAVVDSATLQTSKQVVATADESEIAPEVAIIKPAIPDSESASIAQSETSVDMVSDTFDDDDSEQRKSRRLKRLPAGSGAGKLSRLKTSRDLRKSTDLISKPEDLIGVSLANGRYKVIDKLGKGSMAYVLRASDSRLLTDVVVKVPKPEKMTDDDIRERFRRESQLLVQLTHPHVVKVLDVGEYCELPYVVMQLLSGGTLTDLIKKGSEKSIGMEPDLLKSWLREVARALDFCYRKGMVHRDVKPANILFDEDGNAYVSDFGLTKIMYGDHDNIDPSDTASGVVLGTPNYISPEVVLGKTYDGRADQYSLGITVYHALFGKAPMQGDNATATMINQTQKNLQLLSDIRSDVPRELALAVRKSIEKKPENRFDSCEEFAEAVLEGLRAPLGQTAVPVADFSNESGGTRAASSGSTRSSQSSVRRNSKPRRNRSSRSGQARPRRAANPDMEWLDIADERLEADPLPPRRGAAKSASSAKKKSSKASDSNTQIFGQSVHPALVVVLAVGLCALLLSVVVQWAMSEGDPEPAYTQNTANTGASADLSAEYNEYAARTGTPAELANDGAAKQPENQSRSGNGKNGKKKAGDTKPPAKVAESPAPKPQANNPGSDPVVAMSAPIGEANSTANPASSDSSSPTGMSDASKSTSVLKPTVDALSAGDTPPNTVLTIPFEPGDQITTGPPGCPVIIVGNRVWDTNAKIVISTLEGERVNGAFTAVSSDGSLFAAADKLPNQQNTNIDVWDTQTGKKKFTAPGESGRYSDAILLSSKTLNVGGRWSDELLTWDTSNGNQRKALKLPSARVTPGNTTINHTGEFIAAVANNRLIVITTAGGKLVGQMQTPANRPASSLRKVIESRKRDDGNELVYASLQSLSFSADNMELAGIATHPEPRLLCWNNRGELVVDGRISFHNPDVDAGVLSWFADGEAWLIGDDVLHRSSGRIVATADATRNHRVHLYDNDHLMGVFADAPTKLCVRKIPWEAINQSLSIISNSEAGWISPGRAVSVEVLLKDSGEEVRKTIREAIAARLSSDGLRVEDQKQAAVFQLTDDDQDGAPTLSLVVTGSSDPVWSTTLDTMMALGELWQDANESTRKSMLADLETQIGGLTTPYFVPKDALATALPVVLN
ncbi:serine/threonine-protein kinase [Fuerstiella marisgermanici]|uniref:non-specific serine/threonine protein kinase n=1 Tax=Fuerstiella marisgermanici TaxID=1891926 RepID=A0A1P8WP54_9PLAN|nr:serine/threonine-protein kinase [Fuerstiella marisgermanici]APZ95840.1 Serine/threonine-protein kinase PknA [Fuerstiella marisgermanici]